ncbi:MAG: endonuclease/exonuclease/phosphatase family protein [Planctomycetota bacterium]
MKCNTGTEAAVGLFSKRRKKSKLSSNPLLRWLGPSATTAGLLYAVYLFFVGGLDFSSLDQWLPGSQSVTFEGEAITLTDEPRPNDRIRIATFNIENFGETKAANRNDSDTGIDVMGKIAEIVNKFDIVAIQELRGKDGVALQQLVSLLNASGGQYAAVISELIGNEHRKESYAFVWDRTRIEIIPDSSYVVQDPDGRMYREPMVASFQSRVDPADNKAPFRFTLINVHTSPDLVDPEERDSEINVLADVFHRVREYEFRVRGEDDFILLGDLNVPPEKLGLLSEIPGVVSVAGDIKTNVSRKKTHDHILIDSNVTEEYAQRMGVVDFIDDLGLSLEQANRISDHLPLFAEFARYEIAPPPPPLTAQQPGQARTRVLQ